MPNGFNNQPPAVQTLADNVLSGAIGGIISTKPSAKYLSGARCLIKVNGQLVGFAFGITWNINNTITKINTIDDYNSYELAPKRVEVSGTLSCWHIPGQGPGAEMLQADILSFLFQRYITIEARDSRTNQLLFLTDKAMITSRQQNVSIEQLSQITLNWEAIGYQDERTPLPPDNYNVVNPQPSPTLTGGILAPIAGAFTGNSNSSNA